MVGHRGKERAKGRERGNKGLWSIPSKEEVVKPVKGLFKKGKSE